MLRNDTPNLIYFFLACSHKVLYHSFIENLGRTFVLTLKQQQVFEFIERYIFMNDGKSPTLTEIGFAIGVNSKGTVHRYVQALEEHGYIEIEPGRKRNIRLCDRETFDLSIPLLGKIAAGQPIEAIEDEQVINFSELFFGKNRFALRVSGDSMIDDGIFDGDIVICQRANIAKEGDIVVALVDNQYATLKRIYYKKQDKTIVLSPANSAFTPQVYPASRVSIQGIFVGLCRLGDSPL